jgi:hypothetical protein
MHSLSGCHVVGCNPNVGPDKSANTSEINYTVSMGGL